LHKLVNKDLYIRSRRLRTRPVQLYSPGGANVHFRLRHPSFGSPDSTFHLDRFSRFCTTYDRQSLYFTMDRPISPWKLTLRMGI